MICREFEHLNPPDTTLPDLLLPRPEAARSRALSGREERKKENNRSPGMIRSEASSGISALCNPSESRIEGISTVAAKLELAKKEATNPVKDEPEMVESSSSSGSPTCSVGLGDSRTGTSHIPEVVDQVLRLRGGSGDGDQDQSEDEGM